MKYLAWLIVLFTLIFNLWLNFPETKILADPNDNIFQFSLLQRTDWVWQNYGCPFSPSCLPNLTDHVVTTWAEGYPLPFYYSHLPQIVTVASYRLMVIPLTSLFHFSYSLYQYYNLTKYLLLSFFPLSVFLSLSLMGFSPLPSALGAFFAAHFSTDGLYGIDPPSFLWRGYGLTSQLYALFFFPLSLSFVYRALNLSEEEKKRPFWKNPLLGAVVFLTLTTAGHLGIGVIAFISTVPFIFSKFKPSEILSRLKKLLLIFFLSLVLLAYWILPIFLFGKYHIISFWDPIWKFDSYGWYEVARQFFQGEIFDWQRPPVITILTLAGLLMALFNTKFFPLALLFVLWIMFYFGRTTWGGLIDLIPGMKEFHLHRFVVGIHIASLFLIPLGISSIFLGISKFSTSLLGKANKIFSLPLLKKEAFSKVFQNVFFYILVIPLISVSAYFTLKQTVTYAQLNNRWINEANQAYQYDEKNFQNLVSYLKKLPPGRVYAGRPGNWGKNLRLGSSELYMLLGVNGFDMSQFLPETWSPLSENEQNFDERFAEDYDLLNIRYIVASKNEGFAKSAVLKKTFGPFELYEIPTSGWFEVVTSPMLLKSDKTNFINIVHLWHNSYPRRWKMHLLISLEKETKVPATTNRIITMIDEVNYKDENGKSGNIFADFPFVFPQATVSAKLTGEKVEREKYSTQVTVPSSCQSCFLMFKMSYHPDWQVKIDGKPAEKYAVFPFYLATPVSGGSHFVEFTYQPNRLKTILLLSLFLFPIIFILKRLSLLFFSRKTITA